MSKEILSTNGEKLGEITLEKSVFGVEPNLHVMHLALRRQLNNARQGSACAKTRAEVAGGGRKPWKQKGTGRARAGSLRSPLFAGGGVIFGPKPRSYAFNMPQKARQLALRSALSAREAQIVVVKDFSTIAEPKTKSASNKSFTFKFVGNKSFTLGIFLADNSRFLFSSALKSATTKTLPFTFNDFNALTINFVFGSAIVEKSFTTTI